LNSLELAKSNLRQAEERIRHAKEAVEEGNYPFVVRQCQEAVELALKASLRLAGIEPPKWHDVGPILKRERDKFPKWFQEKIDELASMSRSLRKERELAMYGD
jgi:HEPN domain-containing protein